MPIRRVAAVLLLWGVWRMPAPAVDRYMPVDEIRPGMVGVGRTVYVGTTREEFTARILGVLRNNIGPRRDLILAKLEGGPLAKTGVIAGMSGSPVYVEGRMIGAVAYALGAFPTEAIAGITPIGEMIAAARSDAVRPAVPALPAPAQFTPAAWWDILDRYPLAVRPFARSAADVRALHPGSLDPSVAAALRPIATPINFGGLAGPFSAPVESILARAGFVATPGAGADLRQPGAPSPGPLQPGDAVGVTLVSGDLIVGATGTVTDVDGGRVLAFGHPFFGLGPARLPMTRAVVHAILPSLMTSTKIASTGDVIGTFTQDRSTVLAGTLGDGPETIPVTLALANQAGQRRELRFWLADDPFFTPLLAFVTVGGTLSAFERDLGANTYAVRGALRIRGQAPVVFDDVLTGDTAPIAVASALSVPLAALLTNDLERARIESISLEITSAERPRTATIERVWIDAVDVRPGRRVPLKILVRPFRGQDEVRSVDLDIPVTTDGPLTVVVADGARLVQHEQRDGRTMLSPPSLAQLVAQLNRARRGNRLYVRLYSRDAGAMIEGEPLQALPNSILSILEADRAGSASTAVSSAIVGSWDLPVDHAVSGIRTITITPVPFVRRP
jgi:hypothetical protein